MNILLLIIGLYFIYNLVDQIYLHLLVYLKITKIFNRKINPFNNIKKLKRSIYIRILSLCLIIFGISYGLIRFISFNTIYFILLTIILTYIMKKSSKDGFQINVYNIARYITAFYKSLKYQEMSKDFRKLKGVHLERGFRQYDFENIYDNLVNKKKGNSFFEKRSFLFKELDEEIVAEAIKKLLKQKYEDK